MHIHSLINSIIFWLNKSELMKTGRDIFLFHSSLVGQFRTGKIRVCHRDGLCLSISLSVKYFLNCVYRAVFGGLGMLE